jgi:aspartate kinase
MLVMKFGGTSVGTPERIKTVYDIVALNISKKPVVVVSAAGGVTDLLLKAGANALKGIIDIKEIEEKHNKIIEGLGLPKDIVLNETNELKDFLKGISMMKEITKKSSDYLVSFGERISCKLVASYINSKGIKSKHHYAYDVGMLTDDEFQNAAPLKESYDLINKALANLDHVPVITGFLGKNKAGDITTLGRGGSDYSGAIIGAAINSEEIQIWTDVDGIMTTDPRIVKEAHNLPQVSFQEASELAYFGAKVLHPKTILPAMEKNIAVVVKNTFNPQHPGTRILSKSEKTSTTVKAIAVKKKINLINIYSYRMLDAYGFLAKIFNIFAKYNVIVDMISTSEVSVSVTVEKKDRLDDVLKELSEFSTAKLEEGKAIICVVGEGLKKDHSITGKIFNKMTQLAIPLHMISQGASEVNLGFVIDDLKADEVVKELHSLFF